MPTDLYLMFEKLMRMPPYLPYITPVAKDRVDCSVKNKVNILGVVEQGQGNEPKESNELIVFDLGKLCI